MIMIINIIIIPITILVPFFSFIDTSMFMVLNVHIFINPNVDTGIFDLFDLLGLISTSISLCFSFSFLLSLSVISSSSLS